MSIRITDRDIQILLSIHSARYLTTQQIERLFWSEGEGAKGPTKACQRRMKKLTDTGFVRPIEQPVRRSEPSKPNLYALDEAGAQLVAQELALPISAVEYRPADGEDNYPFLDHLLATTDIQIAFIQACKLRGLELVEWIDERWFRAEENKDYVFVPGPTGKRQKVGFVPDAFFAIRSESGTMRFFVEVDQGTVTIHSSRYRGWTRKVAIYNEYFESEAYQKRYEGKRIRLLTITTTEKRLENMKKATEEAGGAALFWFTTREEAQDPRQLLTGSIWSVAGHERKRPLIVKRGNKPSAQL